MLELLVVVGFGLTLRDGASGGVVAHMLTTPRHFSLFVARGPRKTYLVILQIKDYLCRRRHRRIEHSRGYLGCCNDETIHLEIHHQIGAKHERPVLEQSHAGVSSFVKHILMRRETKLATTDHSIITDVIMQKQLS